MRTTTPAIRLFSLACLVLGALASASAHAQSVQWKQRAVEAKAWDGALSYDSIRGVSVLFSGDLDNPASVGETMEWDGVTWSMKATTGPSAVPPTVGPSPRNGNQLVYDSDRGVTVMFGGRTTPVSPFTVSGETWEWNGAAWTQHAIGTGPSARAGHSMVYDSANHCTLLFGGGTNVSNPSTMVANSETWKWDGLTWTQLSTTGPPARAWHRMAYDSVRARTTLFGGATNPGGQFVFQGDTWEWNGNVWNQVQVVGNSPSPRATHGMVYDSLPARKVTVLFGGVTGINGSALINNGETWEWHGDTRTWIQPPVGGSSPAPRDSPAMAFDSRRGVTVLCGGGFDTNTGSYQTWEWNGTSWIKRVSDNPEIWQGHAMAYDAAHSASVLFGSRDGPSIFGNQTWTWNGQEWSQNSIGGALPPPRANHAMAYGPLQRIVLFGGAGATSFSDTWTWDGSVWAQQVGAGPAARESHALAYDAQRSRTILFGGLTLSGLNDETWEWNGTSWSQPSIVGASPSPRYSHAMAFDSVRNRTVLFGGMTASGLSNETWLWNGTAWAQPSVGASPSARYAHSMAFDSSPGRAVIVLFGGNTANGYNGETWEWSGSNWTQRPGTGPAPRSGQAMAFDVARKTTVLFGGVQTMNMSSQTWELTVCYANCDASSSTPILNANDFQCFLNKFAAGDPGANCDNSTSPPILNANDFQCFLNAFAAGCP